MKVVSWDIKEEQMSYHAPKMDTKIEEPQKPLINMGQAQQAIDQERQKKGFLSTFLTAKKSGASPQGFLSSTLGNSGI